jgi:hypothetical protein
MLGTGSSNRSRGRRVSRKTTAVLTASQTTAVIEIVMSQRRIRDRARTDIKVGLAPPRLGSGSDQRAIKDSYPCGSTFIKLIPSLKTNSPKTGNESGLDRA